MTIDIGSVISKGFDAITTIGGGLISLFSKGKLDETEVAKAKEETQRLLAQLDFQKAQLDLWIQQTYLDKTSDATWRKWSILATMGTLNLVVLNNALAATYLTAAVTVPWDIVGFLCALLAFLVMGDVGMLKTMLDRLNKQKEGGSK